MKKLMCFIISAALVFTSTTGSYAAASTKAAATAKATATVMAAPTEAQVKAVLNKYISSYHEGKTAEIEKVYTFTPKEKATYETFVSLVKLLFSDGFHSIVDVSSVKLASTIKKGSTYSFAYSGQSVVLAKSIYSFESFKGTVTVTWVGKNLKLSNMVETSAEEMPDPKKSTLYAKALVEAGIYGEAYVEALKQGIQPAKDYSDASYIDLMEKGQPIALTMSNANIVDDVIEITPKVGEKTSVSFDLGEFQNTYDGVTIDFELGEKGLPYKVKAFADGVFVEEFTITEDESMDYAILGERVVTFEIEAQEAFNITYLELFKGK